MLRHDDAGFLAPWEYQGESLAEGEARPGYLMLTACDAETSWDLEHLPDEWQETNGRIKREMRPHVRERLTVPADGRFGELEEPDALTAWYQPRPFMLCLNCGELYTRRDKNDFRKLSRLSSEGRSTATTLLSVSAILNAAGAGIKESAQKLLSFTDNRQDASLQAGHFNDFVQVSFLRAAIYAALEAHGRLGHDTIAGAVMERMNLTLAAVARNPNLDPHTGRARDVWRAFRDLVEYQIYVDLRRGWRVTQPNLEQCGLLQLDYQGLEDLCAADGPWESVDALHRLPAANRLSLVRAVLDHLRKKLAITATVLDEQEQMQLRRGFETQLSPPWLSQTERMSAAQRFLISPGGAKKVRGLSLGDRSLVGRLLRRELNLSAEEYNTLIRSLMELLNRQGLVLLEQEGAVDWVQLDAAALIWRLGDGSPLPPDPVYTRQAHSEVYVQVQRRANAYFREFYRGSARQLSGIEGREHTAQVTYEDRQERERRFIDGKLKSLFCSPTMELGVDIRDLQLVHMRNVPPTPANYAQRSGRAGRGDEPALVMTYCSAYSGHDQYFFREREQMVAGAVRAPRLDLSNEDLIRAHVHAVWLARVQLRLGSSVSEILEIGLEGYPLNNNVQSQIALSENRQRECLAEAKKVLASCDLDPAQATWYSAEWLGSTIRHAPQAFEHAFLRWRELYQAAQAHWESASAVLRHPVGDRQRRLDAERSRAEAERQKNLLCNIGTTAEESDFYPYRYLASEGFLPGYNFPRLPVRAFVPRGDGEFIARPRFLALTEFGPQNIIYHEGATYQATALVPPPGGLEQRRDRVKVCWVCGYYHTDETVDRCANCDSLLDASNSEVLSLLEMANVRTFRRQRITCDEEERLRLGYDISTHFRFAPGPGGPCRVARADVVGPGQAPLLRLAYGPTATLYRISHGWRNRRERGFQLNLGTGEWVMRPMPEDDDSQAPAALAGARQEVVRLVVHDTENLLLVYPAGPDPADENTLTTLQYALQRGIETLFQVEEAELASDRLGRDDHRGILIWEAAQGGAGVLRRLVEERDAMADVARAALRRLHLNPDTLEDEKPNCARACYECLLSYGNQRDHQRLDRHLVGHLLAQLAQAGTLPQAQGRSYEEQHRWLRNLTDSRSDLERKVVDHLYRTRRRLPDDAQRPLLDYACIPDFFLQPNICVFCDGSVHDQPHQRDQDARIRRDLEMRGYRVVVIRYDGDLEGQIAAHADVFGTAAE